MHLAVTLVCDRNLRPASRTAERVPMFPIRSGQFCTTPSGDDALRTAAKGSATSRPVAKDCEQVQRLLRMARFYSDERMNTHRRALSVYCSAVRGIRRNFPIYYYHPPRSIQVIKKIGAILSPTLD